MKRKIDKVKSNKNPKDWQVMGVKLFGRGMEEVLRWVERETERLKRGKIWIATVNPEFLMRAQRDEEFGYIIRYKTDLNVPDGVGLIWARRVGGSSGGFGKRIREAWRVGTMILGGKLREDLIPGCELMEKMIEMASRKGWKVFLLGGWEDRAAESTRYFAKKYPGLKIDYSMGEPAESNEEVLGKIGEFKPKMLFVGYGMARQEKWIDKNYQKLEGLVVMGVGRSLEYFSGNLKRAPENWRRAGMEWLYSLIQQPDRWRRQLELPKFVWRVIRSR
jgi:N-acetylglucosaminyldiphosphoundecaprenol N-acetyl-beta-D-mannosaminyltransferase